MNKEDARAGDLFLHSKRAKTIEDEDRMQFSTDELYLKSPEIMAQQFHYCPDALENTVKIAQMCNVELEFGKLHLPKFDVPENHDAFEYLRGLCLQGFHKRYPDEQDLLERLDYELSVIRQMGYVDYFLIVWDFIRYAKENGIMVGPGRGSAAGSMVSYCLGITNVDPIRYQLIFERFLNPERISMPISTLIFCFRTPGEVIRLCRWQIRQGQVGRKSSLLGNDGGQGGHRDVGRGAGHSLWRGWTRWPK